MAGTRTLLPLDLLWKLGCTVFKLLNFILDVKVGLQGGSIIHRHDLYDVWPDTVGEIIIYVGSSCSWFIGLP